MNFDMERKNFENLVHHNYSKLKLIQRGWNAFRIFTFSERKRLKREGILLGGISHTTPLLISEEADRILNEIKSTEQQG